MRVGLPVETMTVAEKPEAIETLWSSLRHRPEEIPTPEWHRQVVKERAERLDRGDSAAVGWDTVKQDFDRLGQ